MNDWTYYTARWKFVISRKDNSVEFTDEKYGIVGEFKLPSDWADTRIFQYLNNITEAKIT